MDKSSMHFSDNFWESFEKNGITVLLNRMRGAKQTCERLKIAYEARVLLEEEYGKTLLQISQKQKVSSAENGSSKVAMNEMQAQTQTIANTHIKLSCHIRDKIIMPLTILINKQKEIRKELQTSVQKLYNNRQLQVNFVRKAHKRHNQEIEKANTIVEQKVTEEEKQAAFKAAQPIIEKLKNLYNDGLKDLFKIVEEWNTEWKNTCDNFEKLEQERIQFFTSNISDYSNLMIDCMENEIQAHKKVNEAVKKIDSDKDLIDFVKENKSTHIIPTAMDYVKLHAYNELNKSRDDIEKHDSMENEDQSDAENPEEIKNIDALENTKDSIKDQTNPTPLDINVKSTTISDEKKELEVTSIMMTGKMEIYESGEENDDSDSEYVYVTDSEFENDDEKNDKEESVVHKFDIIENSKDRPKTQTIQQHKSLVLDDSSLSYKNDMSNDSSSSPKDGTFSSILLKKGLSSRHRSSFSGSKSGSYEMNGETLAEKVNRVVSSDNTTDFDSTYVKQEEAATELDNMLQELNNSYRGKSRTKIRPTSSTSSPGVLQDRKDSYFSKNEFQKVTPIDTDRGSRRYSRDLQQRILSPKSPDSTLSQSPSTLNSSQGDFYDPFYSLSSRSAHTMSSNGSIKLTKSTSTSAPTAQMIYERMLKNGNMDSYRHRRSSINTETVLSESIRSIESISKVAPDLYDNPTTSKENKEQQFIDFAIAQYDYEAADQGEITFNQGDLLGIISKGDSEDEQGWWEASLLDKKNQKVVQSGLVPSNFIETASRV